MDGSDCIDDDFWGLAADFGLEEGQTLFRDEAFDPFRERVKFRKFFFHSLTARKSRAELLLRDRKENRALMRAEEEGAEAKENIRAAFPSVARPEFLPDSFARLRGLAPTLAPRLLPIPSLLSCRN